MQRRNSSLAVVVALAAACGTEPIELASSYSLSTVEGDQPPRLVGATLECDVSVVGGHLTFGPADHFELGLDVSTDCSRGGGGTQEATFGYTGSAEVNGRRVVFHTARGSGPLEFEGQASDEGTLGVTVPLLVPVADQVTVGFRAE